MDRIKDSGSFDWGSTPHGFTRKKGDLAGRPFMCNYVGLGALLGAVCEQVLRDLHGIERSAFLDLVTHEPKGESVVATEVFAHTSHKHGILA